MVICKRFKNSAHWVRLGEFRTQDTPYWSWTHRTGVTEVTCLAPPYLRVTHELCLLVWNCNYARVHVNDGRCADAPNALKGVPFKQTTYLHCVDPLSKNHANTPGQVREYV